MHKIPALLAKLQWAENRRAQSLFTVPSTLAEEKSYNPFMRVKEETVMRYVDATDPVEVMHRLREAKNNH